MKRAIIVLTAAVSVLPGSYARADEHAAPKYEIVTLADGVYGWVWKNPLENPVEGNALFVVNSEDVVVVDSGLFPSTAKMMIEALRERTSKPVRYVINTHWHDDHHGGNVVYRELWPEVEIIAHPSTLVDIREQAYAARPAVLEGYREQMTTIEGWLERGTDDQGEAIDEARRGQLRGVVEIMRRIVRELGPEVESLPTMLVEGSLVLNRPGRRIEVLHLGSGNTRGDLVVHLPDDGIVASGDLLVHPVPFGIGSNYAEWIETLDALGALGAEKILPGHGRVQHDQQYLSEVRDLLEALLERVGEAVAEGLTLEQTLEKVTLEDFRERFAGEDSAKRRAFDTYFVAPAVERQWKILEGVAAEAEGMYD